MDWGPAGLLETLASLQRAGVRTAGAGPDADAAAAPAIVTLPAEGRVLVFGFASADSGVPIAWAAAQDRPGINLLEDLSPRSVGDIARQVAGFKRAGDIVVASIHWGANWRYEIASAECDFAHGLIDEAQVDVVHGHSSHHVKGIEVYRDKLILYGCGDFIDDYEGVHGREAYRADLGMMYFPSFDATTGKLLRLTMTPTRTRSFRVNRAADDEAAWLQAMLNREGRRLGTSVVSQEGARLLLRWG
jgi:poly-gamma-glutamate synthesis protein (capsule biosynthesis protein)